MSSHKKKVYFAVMLLGGAALFVDRFVLSHSVSVPAPVVGAPRRPPTTLTERIAPTAQPAPTGADFSVPELPFPRNLPTWNPDTPIRDLFAPLSGNGAPHNALGGARRAEDAERGTCAGFSKHHRIDGAMVQERLRIAVVDGVGVRVGETVDGCLLLAVDGNKVRFRCRDGELVLAVMSAGGSAGH